MAINFKKIAKAATVISDIMETREKTSKTDGKIHIEDFDIVHGLTGEPYAVCAINGENFINGGFVLTKIFLDIVTEYDGNIKKAREDFRAEGGLDVELKREKTRAGHDIVSVRIL